MSHRCVVRGTHYIWVLQEEDFLGADGDAEGGDQARQMQDDTEKAIAVRRWKVDLCVEPIC